MAAFVVSHINLLADDYTDKTDESEVYVAGKDSGLGEGCRQRFLERVSPFARA